MSKICLNMIVKNESKIITRMLSSVLPLIDTYCICDTGSTDETISVIKTFFDNHNISGSIITEPFYNFGYNRTVALKSCIGIPNADYLLLMDADMVLEMPSTFSISEFKTSLIENAYYVYQGSQNFFYKNVRLLKNIEDISYWGVTHEYIKLPTDSKTEEISRTQLFINDIGDGGSKSDKFLRDIRLLTQGLIEEPNNDRYTFYLANSYRNAEQYQNAIDTYKKRIQLGGWKEEVWMSYYEIGICYKKLEDMSNAIFYWLEGYQYYSERIENLYEIVKYYREKSQYLIAYRFYEIADYHRNINKSTDHLFYYKDIYDYKLDYELSIIGYYCNLSNMNIYSSCRKVLNYENADESLQQSVIKNYKFYAKSLVTMSETSDYVTQLNNIHFDSEIGDEFVSSTPSICMNNNKVYINTRFVDYRIDSNGVYTNNKTITTKNIITTFDIREPTWKKCDEFILKYNEVYDSLYVGVEDIRLLMNDNKLYYNANRGLSYNHITIETGTIDLLSQTTKSQLVIKQNIKPVEKNWVLFAETSGLKVIYNWYPLTIGDYVTNSEIDIENTTTKFVTTHTIKTPYLFNKVRGSTNGVIIGDEIWFITHVVSDEGRRYYYHLFVVLNKNTYELIRYSNMFSFEKEKIEYTLGFVYLEQENRFLIGYSTNDCTTKYIVIDKKKIETIF